MPIIPGTISIAPFPVGFEGDLNGTFQQGVSQMTIQTTSNLLTGTIEGTQPTSDQGPWIHNRQFYFWDKGVSLYLPQFTRANNAIPATDEGPILINGQWYVWSPETSSYQSYVPSSFRSRNALINGGFSVWQRSFLFPSVESGLYLADRWYWFHPSSVTGRAKAELTGAGLTPTSFNSQEINSIQFTCVTAQPTIGGNEYAFMRQGVEFFNAYPLVNIPTSLSFWLKSSITGVYSAHLRNADSTESIVFECKVTQANVWQRFAFQNIPPFPFDRGNWGSALTDLCYMVGIVLAAGGGQQVSSLQLGQWVSGIRLASPNQVNFFAQQGNTLQVALVQHEPGPTCTAYELLNPDMQTYRCKRYYQSTYPTGVGEGSSGVGGAVCVFENTIRARFGNALQVPLRVAPVANAVNRPYMRLYSSNNATPNAIFLGRTGASVGVDTFAATPEMGLRAIAFNTAVANTGDVGCCEIVYDCEI
jgi:hypothetical protein